ncbi:ExeM/NucH family extracellular endonuclease [Gammaproteobacteria bacterium AB-CW1]|uniref:ExeM/NucH family extracellular endonuclease n=1 Tax=Natronospira elongata TaxID=3110268 RepID=A0AAP6MKT4_9GAMM|nr:ExeM/NucH family extracellular endonuclease [Gammaproteobacteria bacterium AB-CW1]
MKHHLLTGIVVLVFLAPPGMVLADCPSDGLTDIHQLKTDGRLEGQRVLARGVVTANYLGEDRLNGFYLQSLTNSEAPAAGIFVYAPGLDADESIIESGREVVVAGRAGEFRGQRQISRVSQLMQCGHPGLPEPYTLNLPETERERWQALEGRLVEIEQPLTVIDNHDLARYGSLGLAVDGRLFRPSNFTGEEAEQHEADRNAARRIILDDAHYRRDPQPIPYLDENGTRRVGDRLPGLTGVLTHAFGNWRIHPLDPVELAFEASNPRPSLPSRGAGPRIAAFNVENYFLTLGERGADTSSALDAQQSALTAVAEGLDADLLSLIELENQPKVVDDLAIRLAGAGPAYTHFNIDQPVGTDAIRTALLWREDTVTLKAGPFIDKRRVHHRPIIAGHFRFGEDGPGKLVAVVHFKAKTGCPEEGDIDRGQGCWNQRRTRQAEALAEFLAKKQEQTGTERVLIMGDINSYGGEDPVMALVEAGYRDMVAKRLEPEQRYSYVFHGESGYLDTAITSPALAEDIEAVRFWHINADEPRFLQFQQPGPWRSSDHDPVVIDFR